MQIRERDGVDAHFPETSIQLTRESGGSSDPTHGSRDQRVQVGVGRLLNLQFFMAQTEQRLIVKCDDHICTFDDRLHSQCCIIDLEHIVRYFGGGEDGNRFSDFMRI